MASCRTGPALPVRGRRRLGLSTATSCCVIAMRAGGRRPGGIMKARSNARATMTPRRRHCSRPDSDRGEVAELTALWRGRFERAQRRAYAYCVGSPSPGDKSAILAQRRRCRKAHYRWAGVPRALIRKWTAERQRRGKTIRSSGRRRREIRRRRPEKRKAPGAQRHRGPT